VFKIQTLISKVNGTG